MRISALSYISIRGTYGSFLWQRIEIGEPAASMSAAEIRPFANVFRS